MLLLLLVSSVLSACPSNITIPPYFWLDTTNVSLSMSGNITYFLGQNPKNCTLVNTTLDQLVIIDFKDYRAILGTLNSQNNNTEARIIRVKFESKIRTNVTIGRSCIGCYFFTQVPYGAFTEVFASYQNGSANGTTWQIWLYNMYVILENFDFLTDWNTNNFTLSFVEGSSTFLVDFVLWQSETVDMSGSGSWSWSSSGSSLNVKLLFIIVGSIAGFLFLIGCVYFCIKSCQKHNRKYVTL